MHFLYSIHFVVWKYNCYTPIHTFQKWLLTKMWVIRVGLCVQKTLFSLLTLMSLVSSPGPYDVQANHNLLHWVFDLSVNILWSKIHVLSPGRLTDLRLNWECIQSGIQNIFIRYMNMNTMKRPRTWNQKKTFHSLNSCKFWFRHIFHKCLIMPRVTSCPKPDLWLLHCC